MLNSKWVKRTTDKYLSIKTILLSIMDKTIYYFFGEFGYLNTIVVNELYNYFKNNKDTCVTIKTYNDYGIILKLLFGSKISVSTIPLTNYRVCHDGKGNNNVYDKHINTLYNNPNISLFNYKFPYTITTPLSWTNNKLKKKYKNTVCIFPRFRKCFQPNLDFESRNMTKELYDYSISIVKKRLS